LAKGGKIIKRKTLDDVAALARVSPITVSRALRNPEIVSGELRQRIESAVAKLGYVPNIAASRLASSRSQTVGVIVPTLYNVIFAEYLQALHEVFLTSGFQVVVVNSRYSEIEEEKAIRTLLGQHVEAIIMVGVDHTPMARRLLMRSRIPVIETFELTDNPIDINIGLSQAKAGQDATKFLIDLGHRKIGFVVGQLDVRAAARLSGYRKAMEEANLTWDGSIAAIEDRSTINLGATILNRLVEDRKIPDAIFCIDDNLALGALMQCRKLGLRVPDDISILGFHDLEFAAFSSPSLSSVATHRRELGELAAKTAIAAMTKKLPDADRSVDLGYEIIVRESTNNGLSKK
jgi:LacI family transcriptional regulator, gluconate utilization system Gnt-I transcriptional repressor